MYLGVLLTGKENIARCPQGFHKNISLFHRKIFYIEPYTSFKMSTEVFPCPPLICINDQILIIPTAAKSV